jgi:hypothetical protein
MEERKMKQSVGFLLCALVLAWASSSRAQDAAMIEAEKNEAKVIW